MLYRVERFFSSLPVSLLHKHTNSIAVQKWNTYTVSKVKFNVIDIWQCWQTFKSTVERFHSITRKNRKKNTKPGSCALRTRNSKEQENQTNWLLNDCLSLYRITWNKRKKSLKLSEKFVKTTSVINRKKNATRLLKADLVFNEQKIPTRKMMEQHHTSKWKHSPRREF